jgi:hypothetical protein
VSDLRALSIRWDADEYLTVNHRDLTALLDERDRLRAALEELRPYVAGCGPGANRILDDALAHAQGGETEA